MLYKQKQWVREIQEANYVDGHNFRFPCYLIGGLAGSTNWITNKIMGDYSKSFNCSLNN